jgi:RHS repeat-associated protein
VPDYVLQSEGGAWVPYRIVHDHLGSVRRVVRVSDGHVVQRMRYDAYGRVLDDVVASGWTALPFGYAGGLFDRATGLVRFGARDYDAETGRWTAKDPIGFEGGDGNFYSYVGCDPASRLDSTGLSWRHDVARALSGPVGAVLVAGAFFSPVFAVAAVAAGALRSYNYFADANWHSARQSIESSRVAISNGEDERLLAAAHNHAREQSSHVVSNSPEMVAASRYLNTRADIRSAREQGEWTGTPRVQNVVAVVGYDLLKVATGWSPRSGAHEASFATFSSLRSTWVGACE